MRAGAYRGSPPPRHLGWAQSGHGKQMLGSVRAGALRDTSKELVSLPQSLVTRRRAVQLLAPVRNPDTSLRTPGKGSYVQGPGSGWLACRGSCLQFHAADSTGAASHGG